MRGRAIVSVYPYRVTNEREFNPRRERVIIANSDHTGGLSLKRVLELIVALSYVCYCAGFTHLIALARIVVQLTAAR